MQDVFSKKRIKQRVEKSVDVICQRGCEYVRLTIFELESENWNKVEELQEPVDASEVLGELKAIMSVYDDSYGKCCPAPSLFQINSDIKKASKK